MVTRNERQGRIGEHIRQIAVRGDRLTLILYICVEIIRDVPLVESEKEIEALAIGRVREMRAIVPFSEKGRAVTILLEDLCEGGFIRMHRFQASGHPLSAGPQRISPGEQTRARWGAHRGNQKPIHPDPFHRDTVHIRRAQIWIPMQGHVPVALIVCEDEQDVRLWLGLRTADGQK